MKNVIFALLALVGFAQAQIVYDGGRTAISDSIKWGDTDDSTTYLLIRKTSKFRDSAGTWRALSGIDSCSKPERLGFSTLPNRKLELSYEVRTSSGNTDSSQVKIRMDSRYYRNSTDTGEWVPAGRFRGDTTAWVQDSVVTLATTSGTTWKPTKQLFDVPGGNQIRYCVDGFKTGSAATDSTFFRRFVVRSSAVPSGGIPPGSGSGAGDASASNQTDGSQKTQIVDGSGNVIGATSNALDVNIKSGGGSGGTAMADDAAFTPATTSVTPIAGFADETGPDAVDEGDAGAVRMTLQRGLHINMRNASGTEIGTSGAPVRTDPTGSTAQPVTDNGGALTVDNGGTFAVQAAQSGTWNVTNISGTVSLPTGAATAAKQPALGTAGSASADVITVQGIASGTNLNVAVASALPAGNNNIGDVDVASIAAGDNNIGNVDIVTLPALAAGTNNIGDVDVLSLNDGGNSVTVDNGGTFAVQAGQAAHDAAIAGNPVRIGLRAATADYTAVANGDQADALGTVDGKQVVMPYAIRASKWFYAPPTAGLTSTTAVKVKNGAAGLRACVTSVQVMTTHQTTSTEVVVFASPGAGASTDTLWRGWAQAAGGGAATPFPVDLCTPNTGDSLKVRELTATSTAGVLVNLQGYTTAE